MKKIIIILLSLLLLCCSFKEIRNENLARPEYEFQKSYVLKQMPADFMTYFNVWKNYPVDVSEFDSIKDIKAAKDFSVRQKIQLVKNEFIVNDINNNLKYFLKEETGFDNPLKLKVYSILQDDILIGTLTQNDNYSFLNFEYSKEGKKYNIDGVEKKFGTNTHSFIFTIKHKEDELGTVFKEYSNFSNKYEIIINRQFKNLNDTEFICFGVFLDQILKENGYKFKNY